MPFRASVPDYFAIFASAAFLSSSKVNGTIERMRMKRSWKNKIVLLCKSKFREVSTFLSIARMFERYKSFLFC